LGAVLAVVGLFGTWGAGPAVGQGGPTPQPDGALVPPVLIPQPEAPIPVPAADTSDWVRSDLPSIRAGSPRPASGPGSVFSFIDSLKGNDATIDIVIGQSRILTVKEDLTAGNKQPLIAVGDPSIVEFYVVSPRQIRLTGLRLGMTDLSLTSAQGETFSFEVHVTADLKLLEGKLHAMFPDASLRLGQIRNQVVVEGEARSDVQITKIVQAIDSHIASLLTPGLTAGAGSRQSAIVAGVPVQPPGEQPPGEQPPAGQPALEAAATTGPLPYAGLGMNTLNANQPIAQASAGFGSPIQILGQPVVPGVLNLLRVPTSQQVMLKVRVAELNRTALRAIGANFLGVDPRTGAIVGSQIAGQATAAGVIGRVQGNIITPGRTLGGAAVQQLTPIGDRGGTTVFGIFQDANFEFTLNALRRNSVLKILAEPNLVAMSGFQASFLAGGEFPVPVPQVSAAGIAPTITVRFKEFGVRLGFVPIVVNEDVIRLTVVPEVSQIDFTIAVTLVAGGSPVPGLNTRRAQTTVELKQGQTLAIAGLLQVSLDGQTDRVPGLGDLPVIGPLFSNTTGQRIEKELVVLVTPYLVEPMSKDQVPPTPGDEVKEPNDLEFYFLNRIEGRTGRDFRSTTRWDDVFDLRYHLNLEKKYVSGPVGYSD
jgi:pilus assembly protein CpaC